ncbi:hypothetical protein VMT65_12330 [Nocardia sp. CDC153]|uniref:hypothetical protein n=1 Tax=Nocardia sp. CDC153 TaxID=3112167 RepID=UPI002DBF0785|nr:hypothetical protein [Nocardia sp. CDC153]MEC3953818.1 hypothetical protein [Nocardia sp. CDC153]
MIKSTSRWRAPAAIALGLTMTLTACKSDAPTYRIPDWFGFNFSWSAEPGVGLTTDAAVIARAYLESAFISYRTDPIGNPWPTPNKFSYPGYERAYQPYGSAEMRLDGMSMPQEEPANTRVVGTFYARLLELKTDDAAQGSQTPWHAVMCVWVDGLDLQSPPDKDPFGGRYHPFVNVGTGGSLNGTGRTVRLAMQQPPSGQPTRLSKGEGTQRYPSTDVFGDWKITDAKMTDSGTDSPGDPNVCADRADNPVPTALRARNPLTPSDTPAPTLDPYPGWPASKT